MVTLYLDNPFEIDIQTTTVSAQKCPHKLKIQNIQLRPFFFARLFEK